LGKRVYEAVSKEAWQQWVRMQTMIINENRLNLADAAHRKYLAEQMEAFLRRAVPTRCRATCHQQDERWVLIAGLRV
jgi:Fe-S cluster biosynthesis and repair protein YggX